VTIQVINTREAKQNEKADFVLNVLYTLYRDPFVALVALALLDNGFLQLSWFGAFGVSKGDRGREGAAC
jgi:hypothetical protein